MQQEFRPPKKKTKLNPRHCLGKIVSISIKINNIAILHILMTIIISD